MRPPHLVFAAVIACSIAASGCDDLNARRFIKSGNQLYKDGDFEKAALAFEEALKLDPNLEICHHNLGLTYAKLFRAGDETPANKAIAEKATAHLAFYLDKFPKDGAIRDMLTRIWVDSGDFEKALAFWGKEHEVNPRNRDVIAKMAGINYKAGNWQESFRWYLIDADVAPDAPGKLSAYVNIAQLAWSKLSNKDKTFGEERVKIADMAIEVLQRAEEIDSRSDKVQGYLASMYEWRATAHGPSWAGALDRASTQHYRAKWRVLKEEAAKAAAAAAPKSATPVQPQAGTTGG